MDRLHAIAVFVAVAEAGSLAAAARRLALSPPAVTRAVAALEDRLGARVFNRTTRSLSLTDTGERFLESARRVLSDLEAAERAAAGEGAAPRGHLPVVASVTFGRLAVAPVVSAFLRTHRKVTASLVLLDRTADLVEEGLDVAVRIGRLPDSSLIARRVGTVRRVSVASPGYLAARGAPAAPTDLADHAVIGFTGLAPARAWRYEAGGRPRQVQVAARLSVNDAAAAIAAAKADEGIVTVFSYMVGEAVRAGRLVPVLRPFWPPPVPVQIVVPEGRFVDAKARAFVSFATPDLSRRIAALSPD